MSARETASESRLAHWARVTQEQQESGLSIKAFCLATGLNPKVYYYWQRKLRETAGGGITEMQPPTSRKNSAPCFAEVRLESAPVRAALAGGVSGGQLFVEFNGLTITADSDYPAVKLAELVRELARPC